MRLRQPLQGSAADLFEFAQSVPVIDTHEHIPRSEEEYNKTPIRFGNLFNPYVSNDLASAGMPFPRGEWAAFVCIRDDWDGFEPYWQAVKHGSYARPLRIALQEFYGVDDFTRENSLEIVARINANNTPGIYERILGNRCGIRKSIRCAPDLPAADDPILVGNINTPSMWATSANAIADLAKEVGTSSIKTLDELIEASDRWMELQASRGAIEFKSRAMAVEKPDRARAEEVLTMIIAGKAVPEQEVTPLCVYVRESHARKAAKLGLPLALHTGVWEDYRSVDVNDLIGFIRRNPDTRMDVYHLGIPRVRSAIQIVKNFPNAYLNLCWAHIVASDMVVQTLKEAIDMVPLNKVFAFGGDYVLFVEKVYGHLWMARENIAIVLGDRVDRNLMDMDEAREVVHAWFYSNPKSFYGLAD